MKPLFSAALAISLSTVATMSQSTELNIYGQGHLSIDNIDDGNSSSIYTTSNSSRLGFNGEHIISPQLKVIFQYETGVDLTAQGENDGNGGAYSSGQIFTKGRPSYIGLQGDLGTVLIGHMPFLDQWANDYNQFADQVGDLGNLWEASGIPGRSDNVIYYKSPTWSGIDVATTYVPEEGEDNVDYTMVKGNYNKDKLEVGLAFSSIGQGEHSNNNHNAAALTVSYSFDKFSLGGGFQNETDISGISGNDRNSFSLGGSINIGQQGKLKAQFSSSEGEYNQSDATQMALGYDYKLDKNTVIYIAYAIMDNDENVAFSVNGKGHGDKVVPEKGFDPQAISIGIVYQFDHKLF